MHRSVFQEYYPSDIGNKGDAFVQGKMVLYEYYLMTRLIYKIFQREEARLARQFNLTLPQYSALTVIYHNEGLLVSQIAKIGSWHVSTVMTILENLLQKKLIKMEPVTKGRGFKVYTTRQGKELREKAIVCSTPKLEKLLQVVGYRGMGTNMKNLYKVLKEVCGQDYIADIRQHIEKAKETFIMD